MDTQQSLFTQWDFFVETTSLNLTFPLFLKQTGELDFLIIFQIGSVRSHGPHLQSRRLPRKANYLYLEWDSVCWDYLEGQLLYLECDPAGSTK